MAEALRLKIRGCQLGVRLFDRGFTCQTEKYRRCGDQTHASVIS